MNDTFETLVQYTKEHFPIMGEVFDLTEKISETEKTIEGMPDGFDRQCNFERLHNLDNIRFEKLSVFLASYCKEMPKQYIDIIDKANKNYKILQDALQQEQQANDEVFDNMCFLMLVNPRAAFEDIILKNVERKKKIEDTSGQSWKWGLHFPLITRLRMAWKLVFGQKRDFEQKATQMEV